MWCAVCAQLKIVALGNDVAEQPEPNAAMITTQLTVCFLFSFFEILFAAYRAFSQQPAPGLFCLCLAITKSLRIIE